MAEDVDLIEAADGAVGAVVWHVCLMSMGSGEVLYWSDRFGRIEVSGTKASAWEVREVLCFVWDLRQASSRGVAWERFL